MLLFLADTHSISVDFSSCRYLDVSVPCVPHPFGSTKMVEKSHSEIPGSMHTCGSPGHNVACHILHQIASLVIHLIASLPNLWLHQ